MGDIIFTPQASTTLGSENNVTQALPYYFHSPTPRGVTLQGVKITPAVSKSMRVSSSLFTIAMGKISSKISFFADNWVHQKSCAIRTITIALTNNTIDPCSQDNPTATPGHKLLMVFDFLGFQRQTSHQRYLFFISCSFLLHKQC